MKSSRLFFTLFKVGVTSALLYYLFKNLSLEDLSEIKQIPKTTLLIATVLHFITILLCVIRWKAILNGLSMPISFLKSLELTMIGLFFNNFLPSSVGGDAYKVYYFGKDSDQLKKSLMSTLIDRVSGLLGAILLTVVFGVLFSSEIIYFIKTYFHFSLNWFWIVPIFILILGTALYFYQKNIFKAKFLIIRNFISDISQFLHQQRLIMTQAVGLSVIFNAAICLALHLIINSLEKNTSGILPLFFLVPFISLAAILPISINSIGVTEYLAVLLFPIFGFPPKIILFSFLAWRFIGIFISIFGGIIFLFQKREINSRTV